MKSNRCWGCDEELDLLSNPLNRQPLYAQVADHMEREITGRDMEGGKLPSEQSLAQGYGVSRTIVREAMKLLSARGLVHSSAGSGARITKPEAHDVSDVMSRIIRMDAIGCRSTFEVRCILEEAAVQRAASHASRDHLQGMESILKQLKDLSLSGEERLDLDFAFHLLIAQASGNPLLATLVEAMANVIKESMLAGILVQGGIDDAIIRHQKILDALRAGDPKLARQAMDEHLSRSLENLDTQLKISHADVPHVS